MRGWIMANINTDKQIMGSTGVPTATIFLTKEQKREKAKEDNLRVLREEIRVSLLPC